MVSGGLYAEGFGLLVLGENDAVTALRITADGGRSVSKRRVEQRFHTREKRVAVAVQNGSVHRSSSPLERMFASYNCIISEKNVLDKWENEVHTVFASKGAVMSG